MKRLGISALLISSVSLTACGGTDDGGTFDTRAKTPQVGIAEPAASQIDLAKPAFTLAARDDLDITPEALL